MPESEEQKEIRRQQTELERSIREDGPTPIPDDPEPSSTPSEIPSGGFSTQPTTDQEQATSMFRPAELAQAPSGEPQSTPGVRVIQGAGGDGMEGSSVKDVLRELVAVAKSIDNSLSEMRQG